jgi:hypothetical protein
MPHPPFRRPLREFHLGDERRPHPVRLRRARRTARERARARLERVEPRAHSRACDVVKPVPTFTGVPERPVVVDADQQGAETGAPSVRLREAADHHLLPLHALHLEPGARAAARVRRVPPFGHHTFERHAARLAEELSARPST